MSEVRYCSETEVYAFYFKNVIHTKRRLALHTSTWLSGKDTSYQTAAPTAKTTNTFNRITPAVLVAQTQSQLCLFCLPNQL